MIFSGPGHADIQSVVSFNELSPYFPKSFIYNPEKQGNKGKQNARNMKEMVIFFSVFHSLN